MAEVIIVLGMHRSGTSSVAGVLTKLGGVAPGTLYPPDSGNARGYFESAHFMHLHDELLASAGSCWDDWRKFNPAWYRSPAADSYKQRAKEIFEAEFGNATLPILKDPRICRFVPFWLGVLKEMNVAPRIVIPIRSPLEVAHSLKKRNAMSLTKGLLLWLRHVLDAEAQTRSTARSIFTLDQFLSDWQSVSDKISLDNGFAWSRLSDRSVHEVEQFLSSELVHNKTDHAELIAHSDVHEWTIGAYEALLELSRNPSSNFASERLDGIREPFEQASAMFGRVLIDYEFSLEDLQAQTKASRNESDFLRVQLSDARTELATAIAERDHLSGELQARVQDVAEATAFLADRTARLEQAESTLAAAREEGVTALAAVSRDLEAISREKDRLAADLNRMSSESLRVEKAFADHVAMMEAAHANALMETRSIFESQIHALRGQLIDAEAALAKSNATRESRSIWSKILPSIGRSYRLERKLIRSGLFDADWYKIEYPELAESGLSAARHYLDEGYCRGCRPNPFFDTRWYLERYEDVRRSGMNPLLHYAVHGLREGRDPGPQFKTSWYLDTYPDVKASGMNPLAHFIHFGRIEGRSPLPFVAESV
jgi:hypothetical protein